MFARRKHDEREDEPLVPHGFLWQATDGPEPEDKAASSPPAQPIEMPRQQEIMPNFRAPAPSAEASAANSALSSGNAKLGAISPPIPWPSPKTTSVIRRVTPARVVSPQAPADGLVPQHQAPSLQTREKLAQTMPPPADVQNRKVEVIELGNTDAEVTSPRRESLRQFFQFVGERCNKGRERFSQLSLQVRDGARSAFRSIDAPGRISRLRPLAENRVRSLVGRCRLTLDGVRKWNANSSRIAGLASQASRIASTTARFSLERTADVGRGLRNYRLHIRVAKSPRFEELLRRGKMALLARRQAFRREPRLWTSMGMAALSALLTMALISVVHQYDVHAGVPKKGALTPNPIVPAAVIAPRTALEGAGVRERKSHPVVKRGVSKPSPLRTQSASAVHPKPARPRAHHNNDDEDYVAPDTYHYYGKAASR